MLDFDILIRLGLALVLGGLIGLERRLHGHVAGPHTNGMVAFGAALFVMAGIVMAGDGAQRVLAQVATGIGFLAGGVILRDGFRVQGLNTAATLWCAAAMGCMIGLGRLVLATEATVMVVIGNSIYHWLERRSLMLSKLPQDIDDTKNTTGTD